MKYDRFSRRMFLQGLGGASLAIPLLPSLLPSTASAQSAGPGTRFVMMNSHGGRDLDKWFTASYQSTQAAGYSYGNLSSIAGDMSPVFSSMWDASLRKKTAIIRGLDCMDQISAHNNHFATTGSTHSPNSSSGFGYSIDAVLEESLKFYPRNYMISALRMSPEAGYRSWSYSSKSTLGQALSYETDMKSVYQKYFTQAGVTALTNRNGRMQRITNAIFGDYNRLMSSRRIAAYDKSRLDNYMSLLTQVETTLGVGVISCNQVPSSVATSVNGFTSADKLHQVAFDLEVAALACGMTKLVMHGLTHSSNEMDLGKADEPRHHSSHNPNDAKYGVLGKDYNLWMMNRVADLLKRLDAVTDSDGNTLLDNTVFLLSNDDSSGAHWSYDMPVIMAGGKGKIKTDLIIDYRSKTVKTPDGYVAGVGRPYNDVLVTALRACGLTETDYQKFPGQVGFGVYTGFNPTLASHYAPALTGASKNAGLPLIYTGG